jgi:hypothetical protein
MLLRRPQVLELAAGGDEMIVSNFHWTIQSHASLPPTSSSKCFQSVVLTSLASLLLQQQLLFWSTMADRTYTPFELGISYFTAFFKSLKVKPTCMIYIADSL